MEPRAGNRPDAQSSVALSTSCLRTAQGMRPHDSTSRMREIRTSGSVGGLGGKPPRPTRPEGRSERPALRGGDKDRTVRWDASTRHLILAWPTPPVTTPEHAALSVAAEALSPRLSSDRELAASVKLPQATNDVEGLFLLNVQVKPGADLDDVKAKLLERTGRLSTAERMVISSLTPGMWQF